MRVGREGAGSFLILYMSHEDEIFSKIHQIHQNMSISELSEQSKFQDAAPFYCYFLCGKDWSHMSKQSEINIGKTP